jgi:hypothetical protein
MLDEQTILRHFPRASRSTIAANLDRPLPNSQPQRHPTPALERATARKEKSLGRVIVRFTGYRVRPLDPDNFAGSVKDLLDGLRRVNLIDGDEPWRIKLETEQIKVATKAEQRTVIDLFYPEIDS